MKEVCIMKRLIGLILCISILFGICSQGVVAAEPFTLSGGNKGIAEEKTAEEFAESVSQLVADSHEYSLQQSDNEDFSTARLIVRSAHSINVKNAVSVVSGYDDLWVLQYDSPEAAEAAYKYFDGRAGIQFVEPDRPLNALSTVGDPVSPASDNIKYISWGPTHIGLRYLNDKLKPNLSDYKTTYVAVVDTGVDHNHEYLKGRVEPTRINTSDSGTRNSSMDDNGHGTEVAGVIVDATLENVIIRPYKVLNKHGNGTTVTLAAGINCAVKDEADVINISVGFYEDSEVLEAAIKNANEHDIVVVSAAGNDKTDNPLYPSSYDHVIRVAAVNNRNVAANFSNYGNITISAPGVSIMTTTLKNGYFVGSGTSLASPLVAAVAAVILSVNPNASAEDVLDIITDTAVGSFEPSSETYLGAGILNAPSIQAMSQTAKVEEPEFSHATAIYKNEFDLTISCGTPDSVIYYTTDESLPSKSNPNSIIYTAPIRVDKTTKILAAAYADGYNRSSIADFSAIVAPYINENELMIDENGMITAYLGSAGSISIPEKVNGITVKGIADGVFNNRNLTEAILPETVTSVGTESFAENPKLKTVMAKGITDIGDKAFYNCIWLKNIYFGDIRSIGEYALYKVCSKAFEIRESSFSLNIKNLNLIPEGAFMGSALSEAEIDVAVTLGKNAFSECNALVNIDFAEINEIDDGAFKGLASLREVMLKGLSVIPNGAFSTCEMLEHAHMPDAVRVESNAFENCVNLEVVDIPKASLVWSNAFSNCESLDYLYLDSLESFEEEAYTNQSEAPLFPQNLTLFYAPKLEKGLYMMFTRCPKIEYVYLNGATELQSNTFYNCKSVYYVDLRSIRYVSEYAFNNCRITSVDARSLVSTKSLPSDSGIILSNEFVESQHTAENLIVYGTPGTYIERYCKYKNYNFVGIPLIISDIPDYITENSEMVTVDAIGFDLEYQWFWNGKKSTEGGTPIKGATSSSYIFTPEDTAPFYYCRITSHDIDRDAVIYSDIIVKDSTPADYTEYLKAVEAAKAVDRNLFVNIDILDEALSVDVSERYSCEQDTVDAQTKAIYDAISNLKHNGVQRLTLNITDDDLTMFQRAKLSYTVYPSNAIYQGIKWSSADNKKVILLNKNGYIRCIGDGNAVIKGEVVNPDGKIITAYITVDCEMTILEKLLSFILKPMWLLLYAVSSNRIQ